MALVGTTPAPAAGRSQPAAPAEDAGAADLRALVERARDDADAFAALYRRYLSAVYGFAFRRSGSRDVAEEVTSSTFERVWRALPEFEWRAGGFEPWLFRIAAVEVAAHFRRAGRSERPRAQLGLREYAPAAAGLHGDNGDGTEAATDGDLDELRAALATLRPRYQQAISLRYLAGLSHEEAAEAMGCTKAVMAVTLHRATAALRRAMAARPAGRATGSAAGSKDGIR